MSRHHSKKGWWREKDAVIAVVPRVIKSMNAQASFEQRRLAQAVLVNTNSYSFVVTNALQVLTANPLRRTLIVGGSVGTSILIVSRKAVPASPSYPSDLGVIASLPQQALPFMLRRIDVEELISGDIWLNAFGSTSPVFVDVIEVCDINVDP